MNDVSQGPRSLESHILVQNKRPKNIWGSYNTEKEVTPEGTAWAIFTNFKVTEKVTLVEGPEQRILGCVPVCTKNIIHRRYWTLSTSREQQQKKNPCKRDEKHDWGKLHQKSHKQPGQWERRNQEEFQASWWDALFLPFIMVFGIWYISMIGTKWSQGKTKMTS